MRLYNRLRKLGRRLFKRARDSKVKPTPDHVLQVDTLTPRVDEMISDSSTLRIPQLSFNSSDPKSIQIENESDEVLSLSKIHTDRDQEASKHHNKDVKSVISLSDLSCE